jgi:hypothetical protein
MLLRLRPHRSCSRPRSDSCYDPRPPRARRPIGAGPLMALALVAGIGSETFGVLWDTAIQQEIPQDKLSRFLLRRARPVRAHTASGWLRQGRSPTRSVRVETHSGAAAISLVATLAVLLVRRARCSAVSFRSMSPRSSTSAVFLVHAAIAGTLAPRIPAIKADLGLGDGELGAALTGFAAGLFLGTRVAAWLVDRFGSRRVVEVGLPLFAVCLAGPAVAGGLATSRSRSSRSALRRPGRRSHERPGRRGRACAATTGHGELSRVLERRAPRLVRMTAGIARPWASRFARTCSPPRRAPRAAQALAVARGVSSGRRTSPARGRPARPDRADGDRARRIGFARSSGRGQPPTGAASISARTPARAPDLPRSPSAPLLSAWCCPASAPTACPR